VPPLPVDPTLPAPPVVPAVPVAPPSLSVASGDAQAPTERATKRATKIAGSTESLELVFMIPP
jgi:hypothetical protein